MFRSMLVRRNLEEFSKIRLWVFTTKNSKNYWALTKWKYLSWHSVSVVTQSLRHSISIGTQFLLALSLLGTQSLLALTLIATQSLRHSVSWHSASLALGLLALSPSTHLWMHSIPTPNACLWLINISQNLLHKKIRNNWDILEVGIRLRVEKNRVNIGRGNWGSINSWWNWTPTQTDRHKLQRFVNKNATIVRFYLLLKYIIF